MVRKEVQITHITTYTSKNMKYNHGIESHHYKNNVNSYSHRNIVTIIRL
jgi:hypothetical protein